MFPGSQPCRICTKMRNSSTEFFEDIIFSTILPPHPTISAEAPREWFWPSPSHRAGQPHLYRSLVTRNVVATSTNSRTQLRWYCVHWRGVSSVVLPACASPHFVTDLSAGRRGKHQIDSPPGGTAPRRVVYRYRKALHQEPIQAALENF